MAPDTQKKNVNKWEIHICREYRLLSSGLLELSLQLGFMLSPPETVYQGSRKGMATEEFSCPEAWQPSLPETYLATFDYYQCCLGSTPSTRSYGSDKYPGDIVPPRLPHTQVSWRLTLSTGGPASFWRSSSSHSWSQYWSLMNRIPLRSP